MRQPPTAVFAGTDVSGQAGFRDGEPESGLFRKAGRLYVNRRVPIHTEFREHRGWDCLPDLTPRAAFVRTHKYGLSVDDHLRGVRVRSELQAVTPLPFAELGRGEWIRPAEAIPIVDVFGKHDDFDTVYRLLPFQASEHLICGRATGTALRSEQFH